MRGLKEGRRTRTLIVLAVAVATGLGAAWAVMGLLEQKAPALEERWTIEALRQTATGYDIRFGPDGPALHIDTVSNAGNARAVALLYPGKTVVPDRRRDGGCTWIVPALQVERRQITVAEYEALLARGLTAMEIAVSYEVGRGGGTDAATDRGMRPIPALCAALDPS